MKDPRPLWQHQKETIERARLLDFFGIFNDPGTGKTRTVIEILRAKYAQKGRLLRTLIICPPIVIDNWREEWLKYSAVPGSYITGLTGTGKQRLNTLRERGFAENGVPCLHIWVTNYESLQQEELLETLQKWQPEAIVFDECFHEDTQIRTSRGSLRIADVTPGDWVRNCLGWSRVLDVHEKKVANCIILNYASKQVVCSLNHPFFTDRGWVEAGDLKEGDQLATTEKTMSLVQEGLRKGYLPEHGSLIQILLQELRDARQGAPARAPGIYAGAQPDVYEKDKGESKSSTEKNEAPPSGPRRQWMGADGSRGSFIKRAWSRFCVELPRVLWKGLKSTGLPVLLQNRYRARRYEACNRGGRAQPSGEQETRARQKKGSKAGFVRLDGVEILKSRSDQLQRKLCFYDLEVEGHPSFEVNGVLVHNCHRLKDYRRTAVRAQAAFKLANPGTKTKPLPRPLVYLLTGTPYPNSLLDIFMPYRIMDGGKTFGSTMIGFREKYFRDKNAHMPKDKYFPKWIPLEGAKEELGRKMKDTSVRVEIDSCMDLPPVIAKTVAVEMAPEQRKLYQDMLKEFVAVFERGGEEHTTVATMAMTKGLRLMQIASGYVKDDEGGEHSAVESEWTPKQEALKQILEDWTPGHKVIVWAVWKHNYEQIREVCRRLKIEWLEMNGEQGAAKNRENAKLFEASEDYRVIIGHPESGGEGINLVSSPCRVSYSRNFSWRQMKQSDARNRRGGSERHATITRINLVTKGTVEEKITEKLANHEEITETVLREITMNVEKGAT